MKMSIPTMKLFTGLGLAASLFWGCQDLLSQNKDDGATATDETALRLSIKDDSSCREQWGEIIAARKAGTADSAKEAAFLAGCVTEHKADRDHKPPVIPPRLVPDSASRCHWIARQFDGGRPEMAGSFRRYCHEDCAKPDTADSTRHHELCREPGDRDSTHHWGDSTHHWDSTGHGPFIPGDSLRPPRPDTGKCDSLRPPRDTSIIVRPPHHGDTSIIVKPPYHGGDSLPKPVLDCVALRAKLAAIDAASPDYARFKAFLAEACPETP
ncbi:MAG: hypothetical protein JWP91_4526 [Fibrobacteres bacterium]|nr:hypothetical protein [Fibrobacterota bacterium]